MPARRGTGRPLRKPSETRILVLMTRSALAVAALCLWAAAPLRAQPLEAAFQDAEDINFAAFKRAAQPPRQPGAVVAEGALGAPLHEIELAPLLNNIRRTAAAFRAGNAVVHVFGDKSENKNEWFIGLTIDPSDTMFKKGWKILHYWLKPGAETWRVDIGGRMYDVRIDGQLRHRMQSKVVIEPEDKSEAKAVFTIQQLSDAAFAAGLPVRIGGTQYRLLYSQNFNEDGSGDFAGYTVDRSIVLMSRNEKGELKGYHWFEREIPEGQILITTPRAADSNDGYQADSVTLGLSRSGGKLRIYYPAR